MPSCIVVISWDGATTQVYAKIVDRMTENPKYLDAMLGAWFPVVPMISSLRINMRTGQCETSPNVANGVVA